MAIEYASMPEIKSVVKVLKDKFTEQLDHVKPDRILYLSFSKPKSSVKGRIGRIISRLRHLFPEQEYFLEIHKESWESATEGQRLYVILHELLHIPPEGFIQSSKEYRKVKKHDIEDFATLLQAYGIQNEHVDKLAKAVK